MSRIQQAIDELKVAQKASANSYAYGNIRWARELLEAEAERIKTLERALAIAAESKASPFYHCPVCGLPAPGNGKSPEGQGHFPDCPLRYCKEILDQKEKRNDNDRTETRSD